MTVPKSVAEAFRTSRERQAETDALEAAVSLAEQEAFEAELTALCAKHRVVFDHEDGHGAAHIRRPRDGEAPGFDMAICGYHRRPKVRP